MEGENGVFIFESQPQAHLQQLTRQERIYKRHRKNLLPTKLVKVNSSHVQVKIVKAQASQYIPRLISISLSLNILGFDVCEGVSSSWHRPQHTKKSEPHLGEVLRVPKKP